MFSRTLGVGVKVNALASALKLRALISVPAEQDTSVVFEAPNVAVSEGPFGTVAGVQLAAVFQSLLPGLRIQLALPAWSVVIAVSSKAPLQSRARRNNGRALVGVFIGLILCWGCETAMMPSQPPLFYLASTEKGKLNRPSNARLEAIMQETD